MSAEPIRIAMWSGPRNISTAMMRSFDSRPDTFVVDEPFYAAYLAASGITHPMNAEVLASQPHDWREVAASLLGPVPEGKAVFYQKHMTHHMLPGFGRAWMREVRNAFLIRDPAAVLASYVLKRDDVCLADIGIVRQRELFDQVSDSLGVAPPVVSCADVLGSPASLLPKLCLALGVEFDASMLRWPPGRRATDGVWAPAWYDAVERSTGFDSPPPDKKVVELPDRLRRIADEARPHYEVMAAVAIR